MSIEGIIGIVFAVILISVYFAVGFIMAKKMLKPPKKSVAEIAEKQTKRGKLIPGDLDIPNQKYQIKSRYGYSLEGRLYQAAERPSEKLIIWLHGYNACYVNGIIHFKIFKTLGYDVFLPTHRYSGNSGGSGHTFGCKEKEDVKSWIDFLRNNFSYKRFALAGESMGAATAILVASEADIFDFLIADSPYSSMLAAIAGKLENDYSPFLKIFLPAFFAAAALFFHVNPLKVNPLKEIVKIKIPIFLTHSKTDTVVPYSSAERFLKVKPDIEFASFDDVPHCQAVIKYPEEYRRKIVSFVKAHENID